MLIQILKDCVVIRVSPGDGGSNFTHAGKAGLLNVPLVLIKQNKIQVWCLHGETTYKISKNAVSFLSKEKETLLSEVQREIILKHTQQEEEALIESQFAKLS